MGEDELNEQQNQKKGNIGDKAAAAAGGLEQAKNAPKTLEKVAEQASKISQTSKNAQVAKTAAKVSEATQKAAAGAKRVSMIASKLLGILGVVFVIIVIIIITIGLITFILSGLGLIWNGIVGIVEGIGNWISAGISGAEYIVQKEDLEDVMEYLNEMGYDLYGYGFVTVQGVELEEGDTDTEKYPYTISSGGTITIDPKQGTEFMSAKATYDDMSMNAGPNHSSPFRYLVAYVVSDNYSSILKNGNKSLRETFNGGNGLSENLRNFFEGLLGDDIEWRKWTYFCIL